jgi:hypothetical protein
MKRKIKWSLTPMVLEADRSLSAFGGFGTRVFYGPDTITNSITITKYNENFIKH